MAEPSNILSFSVPNWITVLFMVGVGFALIGAGVKMYQQKRGMAA